MPVTMSACSAVAVSIRTIILPAERRYDLDYFLTDDHYEYFYASTTAHASGSNLRGMVKVTATSAIGAYHDQCRGQ